MKLFLREQHNGGKTHWYDFEDNHVKLGQCQIRIVPTVGALLPDDFKFHIMYEIFSGFRQRGYGKILFNLALDKCKELGIDEVIVICEDTNIPSKKIIESFCSEKIDQKSDLNGVIYNKYIYKP